MLYITFRFLFRGRFGVLEGGAVLFCAKNQMAEGEGRCAICKAVEKLVERGEAFMMGMKYRMILLVSVVLVSGCIGRIAGWSRFRYEWWSTFSQRQVEEIFGPFTLSQSVELYTSGWSAEGMFLPKSPDGYNVLLKGYVLDENGAWDEDIVMPWNTNLLRDLLYGSPAELEIKVLCGGREIERRHIVLSEVMKQRSLFFGSNGAIVLNYYPLLRIETSSISSASPVSVSVSVAKPDLNFSRYNGRVALEVRGYVESW